MLVTTETMKIGRGSNKIIIKSIDIYNEMFTNDIDRIKQFIAASDYPDKIDANVILEFNKHAVTLTLQEYRYYFNDQKSENKIMMYLYENIFKNNKKIELTILENRILLYFSKHIGQVVTREELMLQVWGYQADVNTRTLDMHIVRLRKKIETDPEQPLYLQTVRGVGYKFLVD